MKKPNSKYIVQTVKYQNNKKQTVLDAWKQYQAFLHKMLP